MINKAKILSAMLADYERELVNVCIKQKKDLRRVKDHPSYKATERGMKAATDIIFGTVVKQLQEERDQAVANAKKWQDTVVKVSNQNNKLIETIRYYRDLDYAPGVERHGYVNPDDWEQTPSDAEMDGGNVAVKCLEDLGIK